MLESSGGWDVDGCSYCSNWVLGEIAPKDVKGTFFFVWADVSFFMSESVHFYFAWEEYLYCKWLAFSQTCFLTLSVGISRILNYWLPIIRWLLAKKSSCRIQFSGPGDSQCRPDCGGVPIGCHLRKSFGISGELRFRTWRKPSTRIYKKGSLVMLLNLGTSCGATDCQRRRVGRWCVGGVQHRLPTWYLQKLWLVFCTCLIWFSLHSFSRHRTWKMEAEIMFVILYRAEAAFPKRGSLLSSLSAQSFCMSEALT